MKTLQASAVPLIGMGFVFKVCAFYSSSLNISLQISTEENADFADWGTVFLSIE